MMDDFLLDELGRSLVRLEKLGPMLDDLLFPRQAPSGENAGLAAVAPGSRPPVSVPMVDLKIQTENILGWWCARVVESSPEVGSVPADRSVAARAVWLREHLDQFEVMPSAELGAQDLVTQARWVADVVDPLPSVDVPAPLEVGPVSSVVSWARHLGVKVSERTVRHWCQVDDLPYVVGVDGCLQVALADVLARARKTSPDLGTHGFCRRC